MQTVESVAELRRAIGDARSAGHAPVALVPTMGNLHTGHMALVEAACRAGGLVVASVFVNPLQFSPGEDYADYPRTFDADRRALEQAGVDLVFAPSEAEMYPYGQPQARVRVDGLSQTLCGAFRAGHFDGVATVVSKLFNQVTPDVAFFGEKDYQQLVLIQRLVADLHLPVSVRGVPTVRESDGLALSSRNQYLEAAQREAAPALYCTLTEVAERIAGGERDFGAVTDRGRSRLAAAGFGVEYLEVRDTELQPPETNATAADLRVLAAGWLGEARLIDNVPVVD